MNLLPITYPAPARKLRLLILSDSADRLPLLRSALATKGVEVTCGQAAEWPDGVGRGGHDMAAVDVGPARLARVLKGLRASAGYGEIPVLVEASRLSSAPELAGVLPQHRAMPCSLTDLDTLARRGFSAVSHRGPKKVL